MTPFRSTVSLGTRGRLPLPRDAEKRDRRRLPSRAAIAALAGLVAGAFAQPAAAAPLRLEKDKIFPVRTLACDKAEQVHRIVMHIKRGEEKAAKAALLTYRLARNQHDSPVCDVGVVMAVPLKVVETIRRVTIKGVTQDKYIVQVRNPETGYVFYILSIHSFDGEAKRYLSI